jgi:ankyrin repeat protein
VVLTQDIFHIIDQFKEEEDWQKVLGAYTRNAKALIPENTFTGNPDTIDKGLLQGQESSAMDFLKLITYLISNNFSRETAVISKHIYKVLKNHLNTGLLKYLFSIDGDTTEKLASNLISLAIEASDIDVVKKMIEWGINPNTRAHSPFNDGDFTPLRHACWVQSVEVVQALIDGGAGLSINMPEGGNDILSLVIHPDLAYNPPYRGNRPQDSTEDGRYHKEQVKIQLIQILLRAGATVNPGHDRSPLATAARSGYAEIVTFLIAAGSDVNFSCAKFRSTPLGYAVRCNEGIPERDLFTVVRSLLQAGADVNQQFLDRYLSRTTVLEKAIPRKSALVVQLLLNSGAQITEHAFELAAEYCNLNTVDLFIKSGARVTEEVIRCAAKNEECGSFWLLLDAAEDSIKHKCKCAALDQCISEGNPGLIENLVKSGAEPKFNPRLDGCIEAIVKRGDMQTLSLLLDRYQEFVRMRLGNALTAAILCDRNDATEMLLTAGADVDGDQMIEEVEFDPLSAAISRKNSRLIRRLLAAGAAVNKSTTIVGFKDNSFDVVVTVLPAVVSWGDHFLIQDIISAGANVNALGYPGGETALAVAIWRGDTRIVELLIDAGAEVNANAALLGPTALEVASGNNDLRMVQFLLSLGADPDEWSLTGAISGSVELVKTLLAARLDRYRRYSYGYGCRALQYAINTKNGCMVNILLAKGIDANAIIQPGFGDEVGSNSRCRRPTIVFGVSALGYAIQKDDSDDLWIVQALLNSGAGPNSIVTRSYSCYEGFETRTALLEAINWNSLAMVKKLIMEGADVNLGIRGDILTTPLQAAAKKGSIDIVYLLLEHGADVNAPPHYKYGATALQYAAIGGYTGIALLLLEKGADVNALLAQIDGRTALEGAAEHGRKDVVRILLIARAQIIGVGGGQYERALMFASKNGQDSTCRLLEKYKEQSWEILVDWDAK